MPGTLEALIVAILFIVPGYILASVYNNSVYGKDDPTTPQKSDLQFVTLAIVFSLFVHAAAFPWTVRVYGHWIQGWAELEKHAAEFGLWVVVTVIALPTILGKLLAVIVEAPALRWLLVRLGFNKMPPPHTCWDVIAQNPSGAWLIISLKDSSNIAGKFGRKSFIAMSARSGASVSRDIYLEEAWTSTDGNTFRERIADSAGVWIDCSEIRWVKFFFGDNKLGGPFSLAP